LAESVRDAAGQLRSASKWIVAAFGALGAALIGGASIVDLRTLSDSGQWWASIGLVVAIVGIILVIAPAAFVLAPQLTSFDQLRKDGDSGNADVVDTLESEFLSGLGGYATMADLHADRAELGDALDDARAHIGVLNANAETTDDDKTAANVRAASLRQQADRLSAISADVISVATFIRLRKRFTQALWIGLLGVLVATAGAIFFVTAETADERAAEAASLSPLVSAGPSPVGVTLDFASDQTDRYAALLGDDCGLDAVAALVLGRDDDSRRVIVLPQDGCESRELDVPDDAATATSLGAACTLGGTASEDAC